MVEQQLRKIVILGTTGSGKTTFLKNLVGETEEEFDGVEVKRRITVEEAQVLNTFTPIDKIDFENSTTTVSMNVKGVLFLTTRTNQFHFVKLESPVLPFDKDDIDNLYPTVLFDTAGQERLDFMQDIGMQGADGVIIFADGTNIQSIERISGFYEKIKEEEQRIGKKIPVVVFINKKDMEGRGLYVGKDAVSRWVPDLEVDIFETSNKEMESFQIAIRNFLNKIEGFPVDVSQIKFKKIHEVY